MNTNTNTSMTSHIDSHSAMQSQTQTLDASNHSVHTPIPTTQAEPLMPLSPNSIDQFPTGEASSSSSSIKGSTKGTSTNLNTTTHKKIKDVNADDIPSAMKCPLPSHTVVTTTIDDTDISTVTTHTSNSAKSVRFSPMVRVKDTLSRHDMTLKEHYEYWLQHHDFLRIKQRNLGTIQAIEQHQQSQEENDASNSDFPEQLLSMDDCLRGLESGLSQENLRKRSYRFAALEEVFLEQEDQYYAGIYDPEAIAQVYVEVTVECRFRAEFRALQDRKEIEDYLKQDSDDSDADEFAI